MLFHSMEGPLLVLLRYVGCCIQVLHPAAQTSGRRLQAWGNLKATAVHFIIGISWYMGATPEQMKDLYVRLYTDVYR